MSLLDSIRSWLHADSARPADLPRLFADSEAALAASLRDLPAAQRGWITLAQARSIFSPKDAAYAFGETDEEGRARLAEFAARAEHPATVDIMPVEGRVYFTREPRRPV